MTKKPGRARKVARQKRNAGRRKKFRRQERDGVRSRDAQLESNELFFEYLEKTPQDIDPPADK